MYFLNSNPIEIIGRKVLRNIWTITDSKVADKFSSRFQRLSVHSIRAYFSESKWSMTRRIFYCSNSSKSYPFSRDGRFTVHFVRQSVPKKYVVPMLSTLRTK